jgi:hypothetical protein
MVKLDSQNILKEILYTYDLLKAKILFNSVHNSTISKIALRILEYKSVYKTIGKSKLTLEGNDKYTILLLLLLNNNISTISDYETLKEWYTNSYKYLSPLLGENLSDLSLYFQTVILSPPNQGKLSFGIYMTIGNVLRKED